jgi:hypothetical protein
MWSWSDVCNVTGSLTNWIELVHSYLQDRLDSARLDSKEMSALVETVFIEEASHATSWREKKPK